MSRLVGLIPVNLELQFAIWVNVCTLWDASRCLNKQTWVCIVSSTFAVCMFLHNDFDLFALRVHVKYAVVIAIVDDQ